jgi:hypothetical protein
LFQLAISPFNWINKVIEDVGEMVGGMLNAEASCSRTVEERKDHVRSNY